MANYTAADVKKLREETDAPMMECKSALDEADGDMARAKEILREKGKAQVGKKAGRATGAGVVAFHGEGDTVAGIVLECETDFVSNNEGFVEIAKRAAVALATEADALLADYVTEAVAKFRENCQLGRTVRRDGVANYASYVHHDNSKGAVVIGEGDSDALRAIAIQVVAATPQVVSKDQLSQELLEKEFAIQKKRALDEGKPENIAENIAKGRVNKEFIKEAVLLEQPFYKDASKTVGQWLAEEAKGTTVQSFEYLTLGQLASAE